MSVQYSTTVNWDPAIIDVELVDSDTAPASIRGLAKYGIKITSGAPSAVAGVWIPGAEVVNSVTGVHYYNTGTTASPAWTAQ